MDVYTFILFATVCVLLYSKGTFHSSKQ